MIVGLSLHKIFLLLLSLTFNQKFVSMVSLLVCVIVVFGVRDLDELRNGALLQYFLSSFLD